MSYEDIVARIQNGENAEDIVKEFTDSINKAQKEVAAAKEAEAKKELKSKKLDEISMTIADALNEYMVVSGVKAEKLRSDEVRELLDKFLPLMDWVKNIDIKVSTSTPKAISMNDADKIIANWLKKFNWWTT